MRYFIVVTKTGKLTDGEYQDHFRADYLLRGMLIPAGEHDITFRFEPSSYYTGRKFSRSQQHPVIAHSCRILDVMEKDRENGSATE